jgi:hypothetical protein
MTGCIAQVSGSDGDSARFPPPSAIRGAPLANGTITATEGGIVATHN